MTKRSADAMTIPQTTLGSTGRTVTILGLGGEGVLRTFGYETRGPGYGRGSPGSRGHVL